MARTHHEPFGEWETCRIKVHSRAIKSHFYAVAYEGGPVIARSPYFRVKQRDGEHGIGPADALRALVADLTADGWHQTGTGRVAWDIRFQPRRHGPAARRPPVTARRVTPTRWCRAAWT